jgi:hypothetical protein
MSKQVLSEDHRKTLMDLFFAIILTDGLGKLVSEFILNNQTSVPLNPIIQNIIHSFPSEWQIFNNSNESLNPIIQYIVQNFLQQQHAGVPNMDSFSFTFNLIFFAVTFFWVISHWIFYHELIRKYPYYRWRKFAVDITIFSLMFIILHLSLSAHDTQIFLLFVIFIALWHATASLWHIADKGLRPIKCDIKWHIVISVVYLVIFLVSLTFSKPQLINQNIVLMSSVILLMLASNVVRLSKFIAKKEKDSHCCIFYNKRGEIIDFPKGYLPQIYTELSFMHKPT